MRSKRRLEEAAKEIRGLESDVSLSKSRLSNAENQIARLREEVAGYHGLWKDLVTLIPALEAFEDDLTAPILGWYPERRPSSVRTGIKISPQAVADLAAFATEHERTEEKQRVVELLSALSV